MWWVRNSPCFPGDAAVCTAVNVERGSLTIVKQTDPPDSPQSFGFFRYQQARLQPDRWPGSDVRQSAGGHGHHGDRGRRRPVGPVDIPLHQRCHARPRCGSVDVTIGAGEGRRVHVHELRTPPALIATVKVADPEQGSFPFRLTGGATDESFTLSPPDTIARSHQSAAVRDRGQYTITETAGSRLGCEATCAGCSMPTEAVSLNQGSDPSVVSQVVKPGEFWVCGFLNLKQAQFTVAKSAQDSRGQVFDFAWNQDPATFQLGDGDSESH